MFGCIQVSIFYFNYILLIKTHDHLNPPDWDLQDDHSLLQADNLRGIDPYSRKVLLGRPSALAG